MVHPKRWDFSAVTSQKVLFIIAFQQDALDRIGLSGIQEKEDATHTCMRFYSCILREESGRGVKLTTPM
jgi:hypothetical protein